VNAGLQHEVEESRRTVKEQGRVIYGLQEDNAQLKDDNTQLKHENAQLKHENAQLKHDFKELSSQMDQTNRAVLGVRPIILLYHFSHSRLGLTG
jgi:predicted RNase H-like nuclease (RuvC/YqgF family)